MKNKKLKLLILLTSVLFSTEIFAEDTNKSSNIKVPTETTFEIEKETEYTKDKKERERLFPLFREQVEARDINLPLPFGVSFMGNVTNIESSGYGIDVDFGDASLNDFPLAIEGEITAQISGLMLDFYPLPFLNVFGYAAHIRTSGDLRIGIKDSKKAAVDFGDTGEAYGMGFNLAGGYKHFFGAINTSYSLSKMESTGALKQTFIITPRIGVKNNANTFQFWAGLMYMEKDNVLTGDMPANTVGSLPAFSYELNLSGPEFAPTLGFRYVPLEHFEVVCETFLAKDFYGVNMRLAYRF